MACRDEINVQQRYDSRADTSWVTYWARVRSIQDAQEAYAAGEYGAEYALRQGLIDLASCCELIAGEMPEPQVALPPTRKRKAA